MEHNTNIVQCNISSNKTIFGLYPVPLKFPSKIRYIWSGPDAPKELKKGLVFETSYSYNNEYV